MGFFKRSKEIFKASYDVVKKDKELLYFPILSALVSIAYFIGVFYPTIWVNLIAEGDSFAMEAFEWIITAVIYFGLAFISQFFNFCAIYTIKVRFTGGNSTMGEAIKYALSRAHLIFLWAIVSATVGLFFRLLDQAARNAGNGGRFVLSIIRFMAGLAWSVLSLFVIPAMVYYDLTPFEAMKKSSRAFTKTWGENLVRGIGMFIFALLFGLLGVGLVVGVYYLTVGLGMTGILITVIVGVVYFVMLFLFYGALNQVYTCALFEYAENGRIPGKYKSEHINKAFKHGKAVA